MDTANRNGGNSALDLARRVIAAASVLIGLYLAAFGNSWAPPIFSLLAGSEASAWLELVMPFLPMVFLAFGAALFASPRVKTYATGDHRNHG